MARLTPKLIVPNTDAAVAFYTTVFGARVLERYATSQGRVVQASIAFDDDLVSLADESPEWNNPAPATLGGSPVLLTLSVDDPDATCERAVAHGAKVLIPVDDRFYGRREGRIADPFGHLWILTKVTEHLSPDEIARRLKLEH